MQLRQDDYAGRIHVQRLLGPGIRWRKNNKFGRISYSLILRHLLFILFGAFLDLLLHGVQRTRLHSVHFFLCLLFLGQGSTQGIFEVCDHFEEKRGNGLGDIALALHETQQLFEFCSDQRKG